MADQQLIEIAKALSVDARVLILDEPTASLSAHEVERLFTIVRRTRDSGVAVLFVSHRLDEVFRLSDRATVLRDGRHVITAATRDLTTADLVRHMVGRAVTLFPKGKPPSGRSSSRSRGWPGRESSVTSASPSGLARSSAWPAWSARGAPRSPACSLGSANPRPARSALTAGRSTSPRRPRRCAPGSPTSPRIATRTAWCWTSRSRTTSRCRSWRACSLAFSCGARPNARWRRDTRTDSGSGRRASTSWRRRSRAATSRRWSSPSGWPRSPGS